MGWGSFREELAEPSGMWAFKLEPSWMVEVSSLAGPCFTVPGHLQLPCDPHLCSYIVLKKWTSQPMQWGSGCNMAVSLAWHLLYTPGPCISCLVLVCGYEATGS